MRRMGMPSSILDDLARCAACGVAWREPSRAETREALDLEKSRSASGVGNGGHSHCIRAATITASFHTPPPAVPLRCHLGACGVRGRVPYATSHAHARGPPAYLGGEWVSMASPSASSEASRQSARAASWGRDGPFHKGSRSRSKGPTHSGSYCQCQYQHQWRQIHRFRARLHGVDPAKRSAQGATTTRHRRRGTCGQRAVAGGAPATRREAVCVDGLRGEQGCHQVDHELSAHGSSHCRPETEQ
jgi:hypothetical protein